MQRASVSQPGSRRRLILIAAAVVVFLLVLARLGVFGGGSKPLSASHLRCVASQNVTPFGNSVLYYDNMTLYCLSANGGERWSYALGSNASFSCSDSMIAAWTGTQLHLIDRNGHSTYNENLSDVIQFARVGSKYVAVVLGGDISPSLVIKDMQGTSVDNETNAYRDMILLDLGFFSDGDYLWTTALDVYGSVPDISLNTFRVNLSGAYGISLGQNLVYAVVYAGQKLNVISTRQLRQYNNQGKLEPTGSVLVYGWQLIDSRAAGNDAMLLFTPSRQTDEYGRINQLRLLCGKTDKRYSLPSPCVGAALHGNRIYAFSQDMIYRANVSDRRFTPISLPGELNSAPVTGYLGMLSNGTALLACENDVYAVALP